ncbi:MAG: hypothetical protein RLN60_05235 [Phycisphaerales bacterium]
MNGKQIIEALEAVGRLLEERGDKAIVRLFIAGGVAGLLGELLRGSRTTGDCDVMATIPEEAWRAVEDAARQVATDLGLPSEWLNKRASSFAWTLPLEWEGRCVPVGRFGPLDVRRVCRRDLIACKVVAAPKRPQDLEDLNDMAPTAEELDFVEAHLHRLESESLDRERYDDRRAILDTLRGAT